MTEDLIGYGKLIDDALKGVVREVLSLIQDYGLPGEHHCYVSFSTNYPGVEISDFLKEKYPDEMTIVLQHQFWDLEVEEDYFSVVLSFNKTKQKLVVPFEALTAFADPSIKFGLQFQLPMEDSMAETPLFSSSSETTGIAGKARESKTAEVISLDSFRKKQQ